jgi:beta-lactamase regulating signal transducer with metallopeptidase domain
LPLINWAGEGTILFGVVLVVATRCGLTLRLALYRCLFMLALGVPAAALLIPAEYSFVPLDTASPAEAAAAARGTHEMAPGGVAGEAGWWGLGSLPFAHLVILLCLCGAAGLVARYLLSLFLLDRAFSAARPAPAEVERALRELQRRFEIGGRIGLAYSSKVALPCTFGWRSRRILLPDTLPCAPDVIESVLAHELCHISHRDPLWLAIGNLACALNWYNPLAWICLRRHRLDTELLCDAAVVERQGAVHDYAEVLLRTARCLARRPVAALAMAEAGLAFRVRTLLEREECPEPLGRAAAGALVGISLGILAVLTATNILAARPESPISSLPPLTVAWPAHGPKEAEDPREPLARSDRRPPSRVSETDAAREMSRPAQAAAAPVNDLSSRAELAGLVREPVGTGLPSAAHEPASQDLRSMCGNMPCGAERLIEPPPAPPLVRASAHQSAPALDQGVTCETYRANGSRVRKTRVCTTPAAREKGISELRLHLRQEWSLL